ncbi:MAG: TolA-binding protein [Bradymonadia bacterium]
MLRAVVVAALSCCLAVPASAQLADEREEVAVEAFDAEPDAERDNLLEEAQSGPQTTATLFEDVVEIEEIERTETAVSRLRDLVADTPIDDTSRAEYMFRLAELYYSRARYYEQRAFRRRDEAFELREMNPQRSRAYEENAAADLEQSDQFAENAIRLYADIYSLYQDTYPDIDAVLYFLGANMLQLEQNDAARAMFETLGREYSQSPYLPQALLMLGELMFVDGDMEQASIYYNAVRQFPDSSGYPYATYKLAWCYYNLAQSADDYEAGIGLLYETVEVTDDAQSTSRIRLRRDSLRDMTLFYSEVYPAEIAFDFFEEIAQDDALELVARLARIYGDRASYEESNTLYRELIARNSSSIEVVSYQREIVRNARPGGDDVALVRETRRLVDLLALAQGFDDATPEVVERWDREVEQLLRQLATTYHSEAQTTLNVELYALAYELYSDYVASYPNGPYSYSMNFFYAELLYRNEQWQTAAEMYDAALALSTGDGAHDTEATHASCLAYTKMVDISASEDVTTGQASTEEDSLPPVPEPREIPQAYRSMMTACDRYLDAAAPNPEVAVEIEYVVAYIYYEFDQLDEAVARFGDLAIHRSGVDPQRGRVSAELLLDSLALQRRFSDMKVWIDRFKETPTLNSGPFVAQLQRLSEQVDFKNCQDLFSNNEFESCGQCYVDFVNTHFDGDIADRGLYNAGVCFGRAGNVDFAISAYRQLTEYFPDSELVPETTYELGQSFHRMAMYQRASEQYEQYYRNNPSGENARDALANAAQFRHGLGQSMAAFDVYDSFIDASDADDPEQNEAIAEAMYQQGVVLMEAGRIEDAIMVFRRVVRRYDDVLPSRAVEAQLQIADGFLAARGSSAQEAAYQSYADVLDVYGDLSEENRDALSREAMDAVAKAQFMLAEQVFDQFEAVRIRGTESRVQEAIEQKIELGRQANGMFEQVFTYERPAWAICAFTRLGRLYHVFYVQLIDAPIPEGMSSLEEEMYRSSIEEQAERQKVEAMDRYARAITIARDANWFNQCSEEAAQFYTELDPTFKAGTEMRIAPGFDPTPAHMTPAIMTWPSVESAEGRQ